MIQPQPQPQTQPQPQPQPQPQTQTQTQTQINSKKHKSKVPVLYPLPTQRARQFKNYCKLERLCYLQIQNKIQKVNAIIQQNVVPPEQDLVSVLSPPPIYSSSPSVRLEPEKTCWNTNSSTSSSPTLQISNGHPVRIKRAGSLFEFHLSITLTVI